MNTVAEPIVRRSACPMDCPDACSLDVTVENGRVVEITGNRVNPITDGYICRKIRHFPEHMYGPERLLSPGIRRGAKGAGDFEPVSWDHALGLIAEKYSTIVRQFGGEAILPFYYGGSNGLLTQDSTDARFFRRLGASQLTRTVCAAATTRAQRGLYGPMSGVAFPDYLHARLIVLWGVNPTASGIHLVPYIRQAQKSGAKLVVIDPRRTPLAAGADLHLPVRPGTDLPVALAVIRWFFEAGKAATDFLGAHASGVDELRKRAEPWTIARAAEEAGLQPEDLEQFIRWYTDANPAVIRCGWGPERNRNGGSAIASILAVPAVAGKFGVRGGGFTMSNSPVWDFKPAAAAQTAPTATRVVNMNHLGQALVELRDPPIQSLFVYNCNPLATMPAQNKVREGLRREDLFTVVFEQVMTDTARYADVILPATTFLEHMELSRGYGAYVLHRSPAVAEPAGESRPNYTVFAELCRRMGLTKIGDVEDPRGLADLAVGSAASPADLFAALERDPTTPPPVGANPIQFVDIFPRTDDGKIHLCPPELDQEAPDGMYTYQADPGATQPYPLALISPCLGQTVSSSLAQLWKGPAEVELHRSDASNRGIADGDLVRVFNGLGEVRCHARISPNVRSGVVVLAKGLWERHTQNGNTSNALSPDTLTDIGAGACFNDARVEVESAQ
jgi:anaerobic selenocysteine-containing dehydrogenase